MSDSEMAGSQSTFTPINRTVARSSRMKEPIPTSLIIDGKRIQTIGEILNALERSESLDKYSLTLFCYRKLNNTYSMLGDSIYRLFNYISSTEL